MPQSTQTAAVGVSLDGTLGKGLLQFNLGSNDNLRAEILGCSISSTATFSIAKIVLAPDLGAATAGPFMQLAFASSGNGVSVCGPVVVPRAWNCYAFSTVSAGDTDKTFFIDYHLVDVLQRR